MGGNALKSLGIETVRLDSPTALHIFNHLNRNWLRFCDKPLELVPWPAWKLDHGDIDILTPVPHQEARELMASFVLPARSTENDGVISQAFEIDGLYVQVDFICYDEITPSIRMFHSGADFGMMVGRLAAWHGFKLAPDGLYVRKTADAGSEDILVSEEPQEILDVLGYSNGFPFPREPKDLWSFIASSELFVPWAFAPKSTNAENRSRDEKRPNIHAFRDWMGPGRADMEPCGRYAKKGSYEEALARIQAKVPNVEVYLRIAAQRQCQLEEGKLGAKSLVARKLLGQNLLAKAFPGEYIAPHLRAFLLEQLDVYLPPYCNRPHLVRPDNTLDPGLEFFYTTTLQRLRAGAIE